MQFLSFTIFFKELWVQCAGEVDRGVSEDAYQIKLTKLKSLNKFQKNDQISLDVESFVKICDHVLSDLHVFDQQIMFLMTDSATNIVSYINAFFYTEVRELSKEVYDMANDLEPVDKLPKSYTLSSNKPRVWAVVRNLRYNSEYKSANSTHNPPSRVLKDPLWMTRSSLSLNL